MKERIRRAAARVAANPVIRKSAASIRPRSTFWGIVGVLAFFILPELIGFWKGPEIAAWAHARFLEAPDRIARINYWLLEEFFKEGGSWLNLTIGLALLGWIYHDRASGGSGL